MKITGGVRENRSIHSAMATRFSNSCPHVIVPPMQRQGVSAVFSLLIAPRLLASSSKALSRVVLLLPRVVVIFKIKEGTSDDLFGGISN